MTPVDESFIMADFRAFFGAKTLLISDDQLGCINNALLNMHFLEKDFVWCINQKSTDGSFEQISLPYFHKKFTKVLTVQNDIEKIANSLLSL